MSITAVIIYTFLFVINVLAFGLYTIDKRHACYSRWRIHEWVLLFLAIIGGAYGAGMAMSLFRHKTRHRSFQIIVPVCLVIWLAILVLLCIYNTSA